MTFIKMIQQYVFYENGRLVRKLRVHRPSESSKSLKDFNVVVE